MTLPSSLEGALAAINFEHLLVVLMGLCSVFLVALAFERFILLMRVRRSIGAHQKVVAAARNATLADARKLCDAAGGPVKLVVAAGLDRELGRVKGDAATAMAREQKRLNGAMKARSWMLGTAGALMPFVGLFGTVLGVMSAFQAIGDSGQGGFAVVSSGISQALVATAVGIAVALEAVVLFNVLQSITGKLSRDLSLLVDELLELIVAARKGHAGTPAN
jgi:biopolymer transport protein ExbB